ncbi:MAG: Ig-like domain-containing protein, partial [Lachnospiraceae bacterium]|nr:Ig-like domain-containing protein [Lachnospiraceae bacterium]
KDLIWESSDNTIATVTQKGAVKALRSGRVTITATSADVKNVGAPESVSVTFNAYTMVKSVKADRSKLVIGTRADSRYGKISIASVVPVNADNPGILWTTDNENVILAAIPAQESPEESDFADSEGLNVMITKKGEALAVMAVTPGTVKLTGITMDGSNKKITCSITVRGEVTGMQLQTGAGKNGYNDVTKTKDKGVYTGTMKAGSSLTLKAVPEINHVSGTRTDKEAKKVYSVYQKVTDTTVSFRSSDTEVATVDKSGKISVSPEAEAGDEVTIHVLSSDNRSKAEYRITVK